MKNIKRIVAVLFAALALTLAAVTPASAALDFTPLTGAVDAVTIVAALAAIAALKMLPGVAKWGFNKVIGWFN